MKKFLRLLAAIFFLASSSVADAEIKTYEGVGEYYMNDFETPDVAKQRARVRAEQNAQEQAGVFIHSYSKSINSKLVADEITAISCGILQVNNVEFKSEPSADGHFVIYRAIVTAQIDTGEFDKWSGKDMQERAAFISQIQQLQKINAAQEEKIDSLKKQLADLNGNDSALLNKMKDEDKIFLSNQKVEEAMKFYATGDYNDVIDLCNEAIKLFPKNSDAYNMRGKARQEFLDAGQAIADFTKAIQLNPENALVYTNRGYAYYQMERLEQAISDYSTAIRLDNKNAVAYGLRGAALNGLTMRGGEADLKKAVELDPKNAMFYCLIADGYDASNNYSYRNAAEGYVYDKAIDYYTQAAKADADFAPAYIRRAWSYIKADLLYKTYTHLEKPADKDFAKLALTDLDKAAKLSKDDALIYWLQSVCYSLTGDEKNSAATLKKAEELGFNQSMYDRLNEINEVLMNQYTYNLRKKNG